MMVRNVDRDLSLHAGNTMAAKTFRAFTARTSDGRFSRDFNKGGSDMRYGLLAIVMAAGLSLLGVTSGSAAPANGQAISQQADQSSLVTDVAGGCGRGWHRGPHGHCRRD
jgi:hypothetical protein